jgi:CRISPR system Cascade subunit CasE
MYISCVDIRKHDDDAIRVVSSPYRTHAVIEASCPGSADEEEGRILWRADPAPTGLRLYLVSPLAPDEDELSSRLSLPRERVRCKAYGPRLDSLRDEQAWAFRLKANPTRQVHVDRGRTPNEKVIGTVQGHVTEAQQAQWLLDRAEAHGFRVCDDEFGNPQMVVSQRKREQFSRQDDKVTLVTCVFSGLLEIVDADAFRKTLVSGMGRAKGFGCGLLTIASVQGRG